MAIYSSKCKECMEASKKETKHYRGTERGKRCYVGSMYECENESCEINIVRKKNLKGNSRPDIIKKKRKKSYFSGKEPEIR